MPNPELAVRPHRYLVHLRRLARRKLCQMRRVSHRTLSVSLLLGGAALVALVSLGFT